MDTPEIQKINGHNIACAKLDTGSKDIVIFCHGFRSSCIGPNRTFVKVARILANNNISSLRFDQYGSGNSEGDFIDSSFNDWIATTKAIATEYLNKGYRVALFGQSMGAATVIATGADIPKISAVVAWVPDPNVEPFVAPKEGYFEESGQRVQAKYWKEACDTKVANKLRSLKAPAYIVQCSNDEYVSAKNHKAIEANAQPQHIVEMFDDLRHSSWSYDDTVKIINKSVDFLTKTLS